MAGTPITPIRLDPDLLKRIDRVSVRMKTNRSAVIRMLVDAGLDEIERSGSITINLEDSQAPQPPAPARPVSYRATKPKKKRP